MATVGSVTIEVGADSTQFKAEMVANQATVKQFAQAAQQAGQTAATSMQGAAESSVILSEGLGASTAAAGSLATAMGVIGTALRVAFPLAGALALLEVLEKLANNKFAQVAIDIGNGFRTMNLSAEASIDTLKLSTAKMQEQIDLLSGKRPNTLAEDLADAALAADKLASSLDTDNRKIKELLEQQKLGAFQGMITNRAGTADVTGSINSFNQDIAHLAAAYQHAVRMNSPDADKDLQALDAKRQAASRYQSDQLEQRQRLQAQGVGPNQDANIAELTGFGDTLINQSDQEADEKQNKKTAIQLKTIEDQKKYNAQQKEEQRKAIEAQKRAQEELYRTDEEAEKQQNAFNKMSINEQIQFWQDRIAAFTEGSQQFITVQDKIYDLTAKRPDLFAENKKNQASAGKSQVEGSDLADQGAAALKKIDVSQIERIAKAAEHYNEEISKGISIQQREGTAFAEASIQMALAQGSMSALAASEALATIHADDHTKSIQRINAALAEQTRLINAMPDDKMSAPDRAAAVRVAEQDAANQKADVNGNYARTQIQDQQSIAGQQLGPAVKEELGRMANDWTSMTHEIVSVMARGIDSLNDDIVKSMTGQGKKGDFGRTFEQAGQGLLKTGLQAAEGYGLKALLGKGFGAKADGSQANPFYVVMAGAGGGSVAGSVTGAATPLLGSLAGKLGGFIQPFIPHFAAGGDFMANHPMLVGEKGPEILNPGFSGSITPNHAIGGGGTTIHVDARGSNDPAAIHAAVMRAAPHIIAASVQAQHHAAKRSPRSR